MVGGHGEGGDGDSEARVGMLNICFYVDLFIYCESRLLCQETLFMINVQTQ